MTEQWKVVEVAPGLFYSHDSMRGTRCMRTTISFPMTISDAHVLENLRQFASETGGFVPPTARVRTIVAHLEGTES